MANPTLPRPPAVNLGLHTATSITNLYEYAAIFWVWVGMFWVPRGHKASKLLIYIVQFCECPP